MSWRKSWPKLNIYGPEGNGECSKRKLLPDERSVWDDYLDQAQISPIRSKVCISIEIGYTQEQLSIILKTPIDAINRAEKKLVDFDMIIVAKNRVISILNWSKYQSEYDRQLQYNVTDKSNKKKLQKKDTKNLSVSLSDSVSKSTSNKDIKGFDGFWATYPRKKSKGAAEKAWKVLSPTTELYEKIIKGVERAKTSIEWADPKYIPYPATWLRAKGWEDELRQICQKCKGKGIFSNNQTGYTVKCDCPAGVDK